jgi:hypothetical protein
MGTKGQPAGDKPPKPIRPSALARHQLDRLRATTRAKPRNSIALPGVDVTNEIELINQGFGKHVGDSRYRINDRTYLVKPDGATYPESGRDIVQVGRPVFMALRLLIRHGGQTAAFNRDIERDPKYTDDVVAEALRLYVLREGNSQDVRR